MLPREHGAWAIVLAPLLIGFSAAPGFSPAAAGLFALGALAAFLLRTPLQALLASRDDRRALRWLALYAASATAGFLPLIALMGRPNLLFFAIPAGAMLAANLAATRAGRRFDALNEASGVVTLCLTAPAAYYAASGALDARAWTLWLLCSVFFLGPIFYIKMAALQHRAAMDAALLPGLARMRRLSLGYHAAALAGVVAWTVCGGLPVLAAVPFALAFAKTAARGGRAPQRADFRALGYMEVAYSALFVIVMSVMSRQGSI
ncbi:MAG: YwiC-like family protein [Elusimicrobia bacterium]|nr:YwiC-like family protein [Elusimicrobiota bacterium]